MSRSKVLLVASNGGHLLQLRLIAEAWPVDTRHWVTLPAPDAQWMLDGEDVTYGRGPTNRSVLNLAANAWIAARLLHRLRPAAVVTTGAAIAVPFCYLARAFGARVVYVESASRIWEASLTARLVHPVATDFFVQWPELVPAFRKARYAGAVL